MDPTTLALIVITYAASMVANAAAEKAVNVAYGRLATAIRARLGREPEPGDFESDAIEKILPNDEESLKQVQEIFALSPALRRAELVAPILQGARILWVDDNPDNNLYERLTLHSLGIKTDLVRTSAEALSLLSRTKYDAVISDMERDNVPDEGLKFLHIMQQFQSHPRLVFYLFNFRSDRGVPQGAFGMTERPDELLHYILDILERERV